MLQRNIGFYVVEDLDPEKPFNRLDALRGINKLPDGEWDVVGDGMAMAIIVDRVGNGSMPSRFRFLRIRDDRPYEVGPDRKPRLVRIAANYRVTDFTFVVLWPDRYMAAITSRDAPHIKRLTRYWAATSGHSGRVTDLLHPDVVARLKAIKRRGVRKVVAKVRTADVVQMESDERLKGWKPFWVAGRENDAVTVETVFSVDRKPKARLSNSLGNQVVALAEYADDVEKLIVAGKDQAGNRMEVNLKDERIVWPVTYDQNMATRRMHEMLEQARKRVEDPNTGPGPLERAARGF